MIAAHDFPYIYPGLAKQFLAWPWLWNYKDHDSLGVNTIDTLWGWIQEVVYGVLSVLGFDWSFIAILVGLIVPVFLAWYGVGRLIGKYGLSSKAMLIGRIVYLLNTYLLLLIDGGQLNLVVAYSLLPLVVFYFENIQSKKYALVVTLAIISFLDPRILFVISVISTVHFLFHFQLWQHYFKLGIVTLFILVGLHAYWLIPALASKGPNLPETYNRIAQVEALSFANISHTLTLRQPHWWLNIFGKVSFPEWYFWVMPIITFFPLTVFKKDKHLAFWLSIAGIGIFLAKGSNPPFPELYLWLFEHLPGFSLFRDPTKFFFIVALSTSVLWGFSADYLHKKSKWISPLLMGYLFLLASPLYVGKMTGIFSQPRHQVDYAEFAKHIESLPTGNLLWIPSKPSLGYSDPRHLSINATTLVKKRPFSIGVVGTYDTLNFLRDATHSGDLLAIAGIKYLGIPASDPKRDSRKPDELEYKKMFTAQLTSLPWIESQKEFGEITLLTATRSGNLFFVPRRSSFVVGSDDIYKHISITEHSPIFVEESPGLLSRMEEYVGSDLIIHKKTATDAAAALISQDHFIFPASQLGFSPDHSGWWKRETVDFVNWRGFLEEKYSLSNQDFDFGGGVAISEGEHELQLSIPACKGNCVFLIRALVSPRGGNIFLQNESISTHTLPQKITRRISGYKEVPDQFLTYDSASFVWFEIAVIDPSSQISIKTRGDINVINAVSVIPSQTWEKYKSEVSSLEKRSLKKENDFTPRVSFVKIDPTHYSVTVQNIQGPATLAFAQNYDPLWKLGDQSAMPLYGLINGFSIPGSGVYEIIYSPQKYVLPGLVVSLATVTLLILIRTKK